MIPCFPYCHSKKWAEYRETLEKVRSNLLRKDVNISEGQDVTEKWIQNLEALLAKFSKTIMNLLELCKVVSRFQSNIDKLLKPRNKRRCF